MNDVDALIEQACDLTAKGEHEQAHEIFIQICELNPESASAWCNRGSTAYLAGMIEEAERAYTKALDLDSANRKAVFGLARLFLMAKKWDDAIDRLNALSGDDAERNYLLGIALENKGDPIKAEPRYLAASELDHTHANKALQRLYVARNEPKKLAALVSTPDNPNLHLLTALIQALPSAKSRWTFFSECLKVYHDSAAIHDIAAGVFLHKKEFAYAARTCAAAHRNIPDLKTVEWPSLKECAWF